MEIDKDLPNIAKLIEQNLILKIVAPTGSGKSTNLPKYLGKKYKTLVVVSDKNIADSLNRLKFQNVSYISTEEYKKQVLKGNFGEVDLLIIENPDSFDNFLIISSWKKSSQNIRLVLTSNFEFDLFSEFPTYIVKSYFNNPVEIRYLKDVKTFEDGLSDLINLIYKTHNSTITGDFLIFALGKNSVERIISKLNNLNMDVLLYSGLDVFQKSEKRRIFVSTDIGKTAIPLKNIGCIFDSMREKRGVITLTGGYRKKVKYISKRDAKLRANKGYQGNKPTIIYRMISEKTFNTLPEMNKIFQIPLHHLMIDIYAEKLNPFEILFNFDKKELEKMFTLFIKYGLLDISSNLTQKAKLIRKFDLGLKQSLLIVESSEKYEASVLASLIDNYSEQPPYLFRKGIDKSKPTFEYALNYDEHIKKYFNRFRGRSDFESLLYIWETYMEEGLEMKNWCNINFIDYTYMKNVKATLDKIQKIQKFEIKKFNVEELISKLDDIIKSIYFDQNLILDFDRTIFTHYYDKVSNSYKIDSFAINLIEERRPREVHAVIVSFIPNANINSISLSYVSPSVEYQSGEIVF
jgi:HrpA-like RNA helicase